MRVRERVKGEGGDEGEGEECKVWVRGEDEGQKLRGIHRHTSEQRRMQRSIGHG